MPPLGAALAGAPNNPVPVGGACELNNPVPGAAAAALNKPVLFGVAVELKTPVPFWAAAEENKPVLAGAADAANKLVPVGAAVELKMLVACGPEPGMLNRERGACDVEAEMDAVPAKRSGVGADWAALGRNRGLALRAGDGVGSPAGVDSRVALAAPGQRFIRHCVLVGYLAAATYLRV